MKEVVLIFAVLLTTLATFNMLPILGNNEKRLALVTNGLNPETAQAEVKYVRKHNLNNGQMKKMHWLKYVDKN